MIEHRAFFGDAEHSFKLTGPMIVELERITGSGIGGLCSRTFAGDFKHADLTAILRLALIGGGTSPEDALAIVNAYAIDRPLNEIFPLCVAILNALWTGTPTEVAGG